MITLIHIMFAIIKKSLWLSVLCSISLVVVSGFFPGLLPQVDAIRIEWQQTFFSSISAIRYPNTQESDNLNTYNIFKYLEAKLLPGDIIFSYREWFLTNELIDGKRKHSSIYIGKRENLIQLIEKYNLPKDVLEQYHIQENNSDMLIIDSTDHGVSIRSMDELTYLNDVLVARTKTSSDNNEQMIYTILQQLWKEYNYDFDINDTSRIYCAQLIYQWLQSININIPYTSFAGRSFLYPQDIVDYIVDTGIQNNEFSLITAIKDIQTTPKFYTYDDIIKIRNLHHDHNK